MAVQVYRGAVSVQLGLSPALPPPRTCLPFDEYVSFLKRLDPTDWKSHDHYKVLRLEHRRYRATTSEIQKSYRAVARLLHPDKCPGSDFYYCNVIRSSELLLDACRRRAFDSVDPTFDDSIPRVVPSHEYEFFEVFSEVFRRNERFGIRKPVPSFGTNTSSREEVNFFYRYWFAFESWREFSYLDEEDKTTGQDRYERKAIEKKNKIERKKRERDEAKRIHSLVQLAFDNDPRIRRFRDEDRLEKRRKRKERREQRTKTEDVVVEPAEVNVEAIEKPIPLPKKKPIKPERSIFKSLLREVFKEEEKDVKRLNLMNRALRMMYGSDVDALALINQRLDQNRERLECLLAELIDTFESEEKDEETKNAQKNTQSSATQERKSTIKTAWTNEQIDLLVKAVRNHPAGTSGRWNIITDFINRQLTHVNSEIGCV